MTFNGNLPAVDAVSGVATVDLSDRTLPTTFQVTVLPGTATGTGTVTVKPTAPTGYTAAYEALYQADGSTAFTVDLSAQVTFFVTGKIDGLKITSSETADTFSVIGGA